MEDVSKEWEYYIDNNKCTIIKYIKTDNRSVVRIPEKIDGKPVVTIDSGTFDIKEYPDSIEKIIVPDTVVNILTDAFFNCPSLKELVIGCGLANFDSDMFFNCWDLEKITISDKNKMFYSSDGIVYDKNDNALIYCPRGKRSKVFVIPQNTTAICSGAFNLCDFMKCIIIHDRVNAIESGAFSFCGLSKLIVYGDPKYIEGHILNSREELIENNFEVPVVWCRKGSNIEKMCREDDLDIRYISQLRERIRQTTEYEIDER